VIESPIDSAVLWSRVMMHLPRISDSASSLDGGR
jgi:hypothetical protein